MRGGAIHDRTTIVILILYNNNNNNASIKRNEPATILTLYLTLTPIFSGRKAKINLHTTPKLTAVMPISCLLPCADPGIFVGGGGGGGGVGGRIHSDKKALTTLLVCFLLFS